jgi:MFS family permease
VNVVPAALQHRWHARPVLRRRAEEGLLGDPRATSLLPVQALHSMGETCFAVSLAGSLFFNVSVDAARPAILLYLAVTMAPFAVLGPLIGPFIDRVGGGHRTMLMVALAGRALAVVVLATQLRSLAFYPLAFVIIVSAKVFAVSRNALVPVLVAEREHLVVVNARLARTASIAGAVAAPLAVGVLTQGGAAWVLRFGAVFYVLGAVACWRIPGVQPVRRDDPSRVVESTEMGAPGIRSAAVVMAGMRAAVGFTLFHIGFTLKRAGEPTWIFGAMAAASAAGTFAGTFVAPRMRRRWGEQAMLTMALVPPIAMGVVTALRFHAITVALFAFALGLSASVARRAFDGVVQSEAPHAKRGQAFAGLETRLELAWVGGALAAVSTRAQGWIGMVGLAVGFALLVLERALRNRNRAQVEEAAHGETLPFRLLETANALAARGDCQQAVLVAAAAVDPAERAGADLHARRAQLDHLADLAAGEVDADVADDAIHLATELLFTAYVHHPEDPVKSGPS